MAITTSIKRSSTTFTILHAWWRLLSATSYLKSSITQAIALLTWLGRFLREIEMDGRPLPVTDCTKFLVVPWYITCAGEPSRSLPPLPPPILHDDPICRPRGPCSCTLSPPPPVHCPGGAAHMAPTICCHTRSHKICLLAQGNGLLCT